MASSSKRKEELREQLQAVEAYEIPEELRDVIATTNNAASSSTTVDPALIQRYKLARDNYLRRQVQNLFLAHIGTFDGEGLQLPEAPTEEEEEEVEKQLAQATNQLKEAATGIHEKASELQQNYSTFCRRRDELKKIVQDMDEEEQKEQEKQGDAMDVDEEGEDDEDAEEELAQQEERLSQLQQKKAQLEAQLHNLRQDTNRLKIETENAEAEVAKMYDEDSPTSVQVEAEDMKKKLKELQDMKIFYDSTREMVEELIGIQVVSTTALEPEAGEEKPRLSMRLRLLQNHEIEITLRQDTEFTDALRVVSAKFLTSTVVSATINEKSKDDNGDSSGENKSLKLTIPPLDDLVRLCSMFPPGEELRFLVRETMGRIRMMQKRVVELAVLHENVLTNIGAFRHVDDGFGGEEQEVHCSLNECIAVVLRLTADCPIVLGSVYIAEMVGLSGWDDKTVETIRENVSKKEFKSPWALIQEIQKEIGLLQEQGYVIPKTPVLPLRRKNA